MEFQRVNKPCIKCVRIRSCSSMSSKPVPGKFSIVHFATIGWKVKFNWFLHNIHFAVHFYSAVYSRPYSNSLISGFEILGLHCLRCCCYNIDSGKHANVGIPFNVPVSKINNNVWNKNICKWFNEHK